MKKIISFVLCVSLFVSIFCVPVSATEDVIVTENTEEFCEDVTALVEKYDDAEYITPDESVLEAEEAADVSEWDINYCSRLIVQSDEPIEKYGAIDIVSGFSNFYIVQFENEEDTNYAYEKYSADKDILSVKYDVSYNALQNIEEETEENTALTYDGYRKAWYIESTGMNFVLDKYKDADLPEIVIGVVDSGYDFNNNYFSDRIIKTGFNNSGEHNPDSEQDYNGHGTMVTSMIYNCTTDNVKIAHFRCIKENGSADSATLTTAAILAAVDFGVDAVNCSFSAFGADELFEEVVDYAYEKNCMIFNSAGNKGGDLERLLAHPLNASDKTVTVGANNIYDVPAVFSCWGKPVNVFAPGQNVPVCDINNAFDYVDGTSFSSPLMAAVYAMFYATHQSMSFAERMRAIKGCGNEVYEPYTEGWFGSGVVNAVELFDFPKVAEPTFSHNERQYNGKVAIEFYAEEGAEIYYTIDGTYPSPTNGILYTEPYEFENAEMRFRAVAYKNGSRSRCVTKDIISMFIGTDDMFTVTEDGVITGYSGNVEYLKIPEYINGIKIVDLKYGAFQSEALKGVVMPDTVEYLGWTDDDYDRPLTFDDQISCFCDCPNLEYIWGYNVKALGYYAVTALFNIREIFFPNCEEIYPWAFYWSSFIGANFPKVKRIGENAFKMVYKLREVYLPECEKISYAAFDMRSHNGNFSSDLRNFYAPKANFMDEYNFDGITESFSVDSADATADMFNGSIMGVELDLPSMETLGEKSLYQTAIKHLYLSNVQYLYSLPNIIATKDNATFYCAYYRPVTVDLCLPATLQYCVPAADYVHDQMSYAVYGTAGINSYAEQWAKDNGVQFINISQETAIVEDIEPVWDKYSYKPLEFDARGFNRTYQWYGSNDAKQGNYDDKAISGATSKTFDPGDDAQYQYYYCKMTSTDKNINGEVVSTVTVNSSMCHNRFHLMYAKDDTYIDFTNKYIFTLKQGCKDVLDIVGVPATTDYRYIPSHGVLKEFYYGTSAVFVVYTNGTQQSRYIIVVQGDTNGDSVVDVLDVADVEKTVNGNYELYDEFYHAADLDCDEGISMTDYQQVVNRALTS